MDVKSRNLLTIVGPTAVGKSETALYLAREFSGEVISCDSMQVYKGFDLGTDKPGPEARKFVPHHLIDIVEPWEQFSAADFARLAVETAEQIIARSRLPIVVGGTGLYHRALVEGLFPGPGRDPELRKRLRQEAERAGLLSLYEKLKEVDPDYAARITPSDGIRIIRALEVYYLTGVPLSRQFLQTRSPAREKGFNLIQIGLKLDRKELYRRIEARVERMFALGLVEEVRNLLARGVPETATPFKGLGYRQVLQYLRREITLAEAIEKTKLETRHFAKRQLTWFRKSPGITWFEAQDRPGLKKFIEMKLSQ
ncbi:MAG: tRNA dimethylallyltransferase [Candidatus Saccharicenans subterraneus]|uniref:tRNA dimethylallyltransferase n=1 Tax=Candidatus Saccharicenans subterraneus TaxID=2508984 RepID=A0A3E2BPE7_9BACT|nr:MAG: tRNA dimethylallyltransferase [Candidatus Saccharicenans subterraneum]